MSANGLAVLVAVGRMDRRRRLIILRSSTRIILVGLLVTARLLG